MPDWLATLLSNHAERGLPLPELERAWQEQQAGSFAHLHALLSILCEEGVLTVKRDCFPTRILGSS